MAAHGDGREDFLLGGGLGDGASSRPMDPRQQPPVVLYRELVTLYDQDAEDLRNAVDLACQALVSGSKVPEINACDDEPQEPRDGVEGSEPVVENEDERELQASVKKKFIEAMEQLQSTHVPKKRRGNLPKEATDMFRAWFSEHQDHPYPTDEEKKELAIKTNVRRFLPFQSPGRLRLSSFYNPQTQVAQITNWFINYRKRIWKPAGGAATEGNFHRVSDMRGPGAPESQNN